MNGILHLHSDWSHDGEWPLEKLAAAARATSLGFLGMTEHSESMDAGRMERYVALCRKISVDGLLVLPGIEFDCGGGLHILGIGVTGFAPLEDPLEVVRHIRAQGGISILAHPLRVAYEIPEGLELHLDGVEVWNLPYDSRFLPNPSSLRMYNRIRSRRRERLLAFCGHDFHRRRLYARPRIAVPGQVSSGDHLLAALREGRFTCGSRLVRIRPDDPYPRWKIRSLDRARTLYEAARALRDRCREADRREVPQ